VEVYALEDHDEFDFPPLLFPHAVRVMSFLDMRNTRLGRDVALIAGLNKSANYRLWRPSKDGDEVDPDFPWAAEILLTRLPYDYPGCDYPVDAPWLTDHTRPEAT
jgi:hypothetical protein